MHLLSFSLLEHPIVWLVGIVIFAVVLPLRGVLRTAALILRTRMWAAAHNWAESSNLPNLKKLVRDLSRRDLMTKERRWAKVIDKLVGR